MAKLTNLQVERKKLKPGRYGDGGGLYLLVSPTGGKSWVLRTVVDTPSGKARQDIGLGSASLVSLGEAREKARALRKVAREGGDPRDVRDAREEAPPTFEQAARACHAVKAPGWSEKNATAFLSSLEQHAFPVIGDMLVSDVAATDLAGVLSPIWADKPSIARKVRARSTLVLDFAKASKWRDDEAPRSTLSTLLPKQSREGNFASMPYEDVPQFFATQNAKADTASRLALLLQILTGARHGEVRATTWDHFDLEKAEWNRPIEIMKGDIADTVPLTDYALDILERAKAMEWPSRDRLVFPNNKGGKLSDNALSKLVRPTGFTAHGFRSSFRTWAAEKMPSIPEAVAEAALAHKIPDKVERSYNRAKFKAMRRDLLDAWGRFVVGGAGKASQLTLGLAG
ncbi:MAG: integrase [Sphingomonadales bacterium CG12_big_fil_rev_8_21_14_0_65_65_10]|nr:MAG: integrase [Sphingomonadales bacterium CG12_big_fil_rev_8_21_14_0_65_65_10]